MMNPLSASACHVITASDSVWILVRMNWVYSITFCRYGYQLAPFLLNSWKRFTNAFYLGGLTFNLPFPDIVKTGWFCLTSWISSKAGMTSISTIFMRKSGVRHYGKALHRPGPEPIQFRVDTKMISRPVV